MACPLTTPNMFVPTASEKISPCRASRRHSTKRHFTSALHKASRHNASRPDASSLSDAASPSPALTPAALAQLSLRSLHPSVIPRTAMHKVAHTPRSADPRQACHCIWSMRDVWSTPAPSGRHPITFGKSFDLVSLIVRRVDFGLSRRGSVWSGSVWSWLFGPGSV